MRGGDGGMLRSGALAALSALLTAVGHLAGGGTLPGVAVLLVLLPLLAAVFLTIADRCRTMVATVGTLAAGQFALHQLLVLWHQSHVATEPAVPSGAAMLAMHAAVTLATAGGLRHADSAVAALGAALRRVVPRRPTPLPVDLPLPTRVVPASDVPARIARTLAVAHVRRGPPVGC